MERENDLRKNEIRFEQMAELNCSGYNSCFPNFGKLFKKHLAANLKKGIKVWGWGKVALDRARIREPPAGLGQRVHKWSGKVGFGKV